MVCDMKNISSSQELSAVLSEFAAELMKHSACAMHQLIHREGMSMPRLVTMMFLHSEGPATLSQVSEHLALSLGATSHLVDQLVHQSFVSRVEDPVDRRHKQLALTEAGEAFVEEVKRLRAAEITQRVADMPPELQQDALRVMKELVVQLRAVDEN